MKPTTRIACAAAALALALAGSLAAAGEGRVLASLVDEAGAPVKGAKVVVTRPGTKYSLEKTSDAKGQVMLLILDATQQYQVRVEKEGYQPFEGPLKAAIGDTTRLTFTLVKAAAAAPAAAAPQELSGKDKAVEAYNAGVTKLRAGDNAGAAPEFERAAALDPQLAEAPAVLAELYIELGRPADALAAADRYLALKPGDARGLRARYDALKKSGDTAKAKEALDALVASAAQDPETAVRLFNEGAELTRSKRPEAYDEAAVFFEKAIQLSPDNPKFAIAYYVTGLAYAKDESKKDLARERLEKFLELAPEHAEAANAREMLTYLKK